MASQVAQPKSAKKFDDFKALWEKFSQCPDQQLYLNTPPGGFNPVTTNGYAIISAFDNSLMGLFWRNYYIRLGEDYVKEESQKAPSQIHRLVTRCIENIPHYVRSETTSFQEFVKECNETIVIASFINEIPAMGVINLIRFLLHNQNTPLLSKWYILLAYWVYRNNLFDKNNDEDKEKMHLALNAIRKKLRKQPFFSELFIHNGIIKANRILQKLGYLTFDTLPKTSEQINSISTKDPAPWTGTFFITVKNVRFRNGYVWIYHPKFPMGQDGHLPLRYELPQSRDVYASINEYLQKKLPPIKVEAKNGRITKVLTPVSLTDCIELIEHRSERPSITRSAPKPKIERRDVPKTEVTAIIQKYKSRYLDYLCSCQLDSHKVICCIEQRTTESGASENEYSFIFTLKATPLTSVLIFENVKDSRSTYVFVINSQKYDECIDNIFSYFASDILNKRQKMASGELRINQTGIRESQRLFHTNYLDWCDRIKVFRR